MKEYTITEISGNKQMDPMIYWYRYFLKFCVYICCKHLCNCARLGYLGNSLDPVKELKYVPNADYFLREHLFKSQPFVVRNFGNHDKLQEMFNEKSLVKTLGDKKGRVYRGQMNATTWPIEVKSTFKDFITNAPNIKMYWDSLLPHSHPIYTNFSLPFCLWCKEIRKKKMDYNLLYTFWNVSSVFHHDGSENIFYQVKGKKTWLLADHSHSNEAYANDYTLQAGLSPIDPENVDLNKYPKVRDIKFYEVTTKPGDLLYIPEYWWHQVRSKGGENIGINLWLEYFDFSAKIEGINDVIDVVAGAEQFAKNRRAASLPECLVLHETLNDNILNRNADKDSFQIFFGGDDLFYYSLDSMSGEIIWKKETEKDAGSTGVMGESADAVFIAGEDGFVNCFHTKDGSIKWSTKLGDGITSGLRLYQNKIYAACLDGHVYCLNKKTGKILWKSEKFKGELWSSSAIDDNGDIITCVLPDFNTEPKGTTTVAKLNGDTGDIIWEYATRAEIFASPALHSATKLVFVADYSGHVYCLGSSTGKLKWEYNVKHPIDSSPIISPNGTLFMSMNGIFSAIDSNSQNLIWEKKIKNTESSISSPLLVPEKNHLYSAVGSVLYCLNSVNGDIIWEFSATAAFMASPRVDKNSVLYIGSIDSHMYAVKSDSGKLIWKSKMSGPIVGSAVMHRENLITSYGGLLST